MSCMSEGSCAVVFERYQNKLDHEMKIVFLTSRSNFFMWARCRDVSCLDANLVIDVCKQKNLRGQIHIELIIILFYLKLIHVEAP